MYARICYMNFRIEYRKIRSKDYQTLMSMVNVIGGYWSVIIARTRGELP